MKQLHDPDFEVIVCDPSQSFRWNAHGYPHHLAKWHHHPEYELHLTLETGGKMMIGDHIGPFEPGCLVLTGPNLPHNWVSDLSPGQRLAQRDMLVQFAPDLVRTLKGFAEMEAVEALLRESAYGIEFAGATRQEGAVLLAQIGGARGIRRLTLFLELLHRLAAVPAERRVLSQCAPGIGAHTATSRRLETVMAHISSQYTEDLRLGDMADLVHMATSTFSRFFKRQTGHTFARYVNQMRVHHACRLLASTDLSITEVCFESGVNNTANFNRQVVARCRETPREYRAKLRETPLSAGPSAAVRVNPRPGAGTGPVRQKCLPDRA